jgi:predicted Fe-S protein YdhL (DUF1289 family)
MPGQPQESPCNGQCKYVELDKVPTCVGCGRTYDDLSHWFYMDKQQKRECIKRCKQNLKKLAKI